MDTSAQGTAFTDNRPDGSEMATDRHPPGRNLNRAGGREFQGGIGELEPMRPDGQHQPIGARRAKHTSGFEDVHLDRCVNRQPSPGRPRVGECGRHDDRRCGSARDVDRAIHDVIARRNGHAVLTGWNVIENERRHASRNAVHSDLRTGWFGTDFKPSAQDWRRHREFHVLRHHAAGLDGDRQSSRHRSACNLDTVRPRSERDPKRGRATSHTIDGDRRAVGE